MKTKARLLSLNHIDQIKNEFKLVGVDPKGQRIMLPKALFYLIRVDELDYRAANILKQEMLAKGGEAAISRNVYELKPELASTIIFATKAQLTKALKVLSKQPFGLKKLAEDIEKLLEIESSKPPSIKAGKFYLNFDRTLIMGILNATPDSFSEEGQYYDHNKAKKHIQKMAEAGADIIDIGGESTRPGAQEVEAGEELERVMPLVEYTVSNFEIPVSIDSYKPEVVQEAVKAGASIINDIYGLRYPGMIDLVGQLNIPVIIMHMQGKPKNMQQNPKYKDCLGEIIDFLRERSLLAIDNGLDYDNILVDPGIGFGKTVDHNLELISRLSEIKSLGFPVVLGTSRKSFIGNTLDLPVDERLEGTAASVALGIREGANIVRVHDVLEMTRVARMTDAIIGKKS